MSCSVAKAGPLVLVLVVLLPMLWLSPVSAAEMTIGVIIPDDVPYYRSIHNALLLKLHKAGYAQRIEFAVQKPYPEPMSLTNAARKLIAYDVDAIIAYGAPAAMSVMAEKSSVPVIYAGVYDPLIATIKGKNVTGISAKVSVSSLLRYLRGVVSITTLGVAYNTGEADSLSQMKEVQRLAGQYGMKVTGINLVKPQDARQALAGKKMDALLITGSSIAGIATPALMDFAHTNRLPVGSFLLNHSPSAVVSLSVSAREQGEKAAERLMKLMDGISPDRIRPETSNDIELIFNLKEAASLGCRIPMELVTEATRLIQ